VLNYLFSQNVETDETFWKLLTTAAEQTFDQLVTDQQDSFEFDWYLLVV